LIQKIGGYERYQDNVRIIVAAAALLHGAHEVGERTPDHEKTECR
jgi:hypothetical protein